MKQSLQLKTRPKQLIGSLLLNIAIHTFAVACVFDDSTSHSVNAALGIIRLIYIIRPFVKESHKKNFKHLLSNLGLQMK